MPTCGRGETGRGWERERERWRTLNHACSVQGIAYEQTSERMDTNSVKPTYTHVDLRKHSLNHPPVKYFLFFLRILNFDLIQNIRTKSYANIMYHIFTKPSTFNLQREHITKLKSQKHAKAHAQPPSPTPTIHCPYPHLHTRPPPPPLPFYPCSSTLTPTLNPVGHQSTNWIVLLVLIEAMAALTSLGTTSPRYNMQQAMYFPWRGSHFTIWKAEEILSIIIIIIITTTITVRIKDRRLGNGMAEKENGMNYTVRQVGRKNNNGKDLKNCKEVSYIITFTQKMATTSCSIEIRHKL